MVCHNLYFPFGVISGVLQDNSKVKSGCVAVTKWLCLFRIVSVPLPIPHYYFQCSTELDLAAIDITGNFPIFLYDWHGQPESAMGF